MIHLQKSGVSQLATQIMAAGDKNHSNKLGGFITAALFASKLQDMNLSISKAVSMPAKTAGINPDGQQIFSINGSSVFTAYAADDNGKYSAQSEYWTNYGQELIKAIGTKKDELNKTPDSVPDPTPTPDPDPTPAPSAKLQYGLSEIQQFHLSVISIIILDMAGVHSFLHILMILLQ